jgi:phenylacetate 2-hydroxylase
MTLIRVFHFHAVANLTIRAQKEAFKTNLPTIYGVPEVPGFLPFVGHLDSLGGRNNENDATIYSKWAAKVASDIFQCRIGNQRTVVVNSFSAVRELWVTHSNKLVDRPPQPGFLENLGIDITGSPLIKIRRYRQAAMKALGRPMWPKYFHLLEPSSVSLVQSIYTRGQNGQEPMEIYPYLRQVIFDLVLSLTYGARFGDLNNTFINEFLDSIIAITSVRSSTACYRHYVPLLRLIPQRTTNITESERVRKAHTNVLYDSYLQRIAKGEEVDCILTTLQAEGLTIEEVHGTCLSLLQAAPDTITSTIYQCIGWLCSPEGRPTQSAALAAILEAYNGDKDLAWEMAFREEKVPLITSLCSETLRHYTLTPYGVPRQTVDNIHFRGSTLPKGLTVLMNAQQANHDIYQYGADAMNFKPERFIENSNPLPHLSYGAGARICPAVALSNRIISALLIRILLAFEIEQVSGSDLRQPNIDPICFSNIHDQLVASPQLYDCRLVARDLKWLEEVISKAR